MKKSSVLGGLAFAAILGSVFTFPVYAKEKTFPRQTVMQLISEPIRSPRI